MVMPCLACNYCQWCDTADDSLTCYHIREMELVTTSVPYDEVVCEVPREQKDWAVEVMKGMTEGLVPVRLPSEVWVGENWNDMEGV